MKLITPALLLLVIFFFVSCSEEDDQDELKEEEIIITDHNAISSSISFIENEYEIEKKSGAFPEPGDYDFLKLENSVIVGIEGSFLAIPLETDETEADGIYLRVKDSEEYYHLYRSVAYYNFDIYINLPEGLQPGSFTIEYIAYSSFLGNGKLKELEINVSTRGGENSPFISNTEWSYIGIIEVTASGEELIPKVGQLDDNGFVATMQCDGENKEFEVNSGGRIDYIYTSYHADGTSDLEFQSYYRFYNPDKSNCVEGIIYDEYIDHAMGTGSWSYDNSTGAFVTTRAYEYEDSRLDISSSLAYIVFEDNLLKFYPNPTGSNLNATGFYYEPR